MVLLGGSALLLCASLLPWYRIEGRGFVLEFSGWHDLGVLAWILTVDLLAWELLRLSPYAPVEGDRGDRFSACGGLCVSAVGGTFVLQRLADGGLGSGWYAGLVLVLALGAASVQLFADARGPQAVAAALGRTDPPHDEPGVDVPTWRPRPEDADPAPGRWEKTLAERQRDAPPLWADRDDRGPSPSAGRGGGPRPSS